MSAALQRVAQIVGLKAVCVLSQWAAIARYCSYMFTASVYNVLIASPGDTVEFRDAVENEIHRWNGLNAEDRGIVLLPRRWENDAVALLAGTDGQAVINNQLVDTAASIIGILHGHLGTPTGRAPSGTVEEIQRAKDANKPVHVFFSDVPVNPSAIDQAKFAALQEFKRDLGKTGGLYDTFQSTEQLRELVRRAIAFDVRGLGPKPAAVSPTADLRPSFRPSQERLHLYNAGTETANGTTVKVEAVGPGDPPSVWHDDEPVDIDPGGEHTYPVNAHAQTARRWRVNMSWTDTAGNPHTPTREITND